MLFTWDSASCAAPRLRRPRPIALGLLLAVLAAARVAAQPAPPPPPPGDQVAALRDILKGEAGPDLAARQATINQLIGKMDLEQLSRVLLLQEWRTIENAAPRTDAERRRMEQDTQARAAAAERFRQKAKEAMEAALKEGPGGNNPQVQAALMLDRAATANLIGETAAAGRKLDSLTLIYGGGRSQRGQIGYLAQQLSELTVPLIKLTRIKTDPAAPAASDEARRAAARALGQIQPADPAQVVGALEQLLGDENNSLGLRVAAAESMDHLAQAAAEEMQRSLGLDEAVQNRFVDFSQAVWLAVLRQGLAPGQPVEVRRASLSAFARIATEMLDISVIPEANLPPPPVDDPKMASEAQERTNHYYHRLAEVFTEFQQNAAPLAAAAKDQDLQVRQTALSVLVDLANVQQRLMNLASGNSAPPPPGPPPGGPAPSDGKTIKPQAARFLGSALTLIVADEPVREQSEQQAFDAVKAGMKDMLGALKDGLQAPDVGTRRAAMDVLEILNDSALPDLDAIIQALRDQDEFVRWAAARTLGELARTSTDKAGFNRQAEAAVQGVTELMRDQDVGVRLAAVTALMRFGPRAASAAPMLTRVLNHSQTEAALRIVPTRETEPELVTGDPTVRISAFRALEAIDSEATVQALPEAVIALQDHNLQVRQAAADMIGQVGPKAPEEYRTQLIVALGKALADTDGDVRRAAGGALLRLMPPKTK